MIVVLEEVERGGDVAVGADEQVVGCVALRVHSPALTEIASLAVDESQHGQGIGRRLIEAAVLRAHTRGARRVFAFTHRDKLFLQLGFQPAPVTEFPQKLASDYGGFALAAGPKAAVVLDLESPASAPVAAPSTSLSWSKRGIACARQPLFR